MLWYLGTQEKSRKNKKKRDEYQDLQIELRRLWDKPVEIVPIIIEALGTIPKPLKRNLDKSGADVAPGLLQKSEVLETAHIIERVMASYTGRMQPGDPTLKESFIIAVMEQKKHKRKKKQ